jgi:hypothetical protein
LEINVPETGVLLADLLNSGGQQVKALFNERLVKGVHKIPLAGKFNNLPAGLYIIKMQSGTKTATLKIIVQ